jgi:porin
MNRRFISIAVVAALATGLGTTSALAQTTTDTTATSSPTTPLANHPVSDDGSPGAPLSAVATRLADDGVKLRSALIDQYAGNTTGGVRQGHSNVGQFNIGADLDLDKLLGIGGGSFHITVYRDYGQALNQNVTGTFTKQQYIYKNPYERWHLGLFAYEQKLLDDRLDILVGRLGSTTFYGHLVTNCQFQSGTLCGEPRIIVSEAGFSLLPSATWGTNIKYRTTEHSYLETGIFEVNPTTSASNGLDFSIDGATGFTVPVEWGWTRTDPAKTQYPFELKAGGYLSTAPLSDPYYNTLGLSRALHGGSARQINSSRDGVYVMGDRVVWRPDPMGSERLALFGGVVQQLDEAEIMRQQIYAGFVWTGPFRSRPTDTLAFSVNEFELTPREREYLADARKKAGGSGTNNAHQTDYELSYGLRLAQGLQLMPNIQYVVHPDNSTIPNTKVLPKNMLVFGLGLRVDIGYLLGFEHAQADD